MEKTLVYILTDVVDKVSAAMLPQLQQLNKDYTGVRFDYGHPADIIGRIEQLTKTPKFMYDAYPLIGLFLDFSEQKGRAINIRSSVSLNMFICCQTMAKYTPQQRTELSFVPILLPIYEEFKKQLFASKYILKPEIGFKHTEIKRYQWGKGGLEYYNNGQKNIFNDFIDAIEIQGLELDISFGSNC